MKKIISYVLLLSLVLTIAISAMPSAQAVSTTLVDQQMTQIVGGVKWTCVGIAAVAVISGGVLGGLFFVAAGVVAGCFD